jgi:hypothetical protein
MRNGHEGIPSAMALAIFGISWAATVAVVLVVFAR